MAVKNAKTPDTVSKVIHDRATRGLQAERSEEDKELRAEKWRAEKSDRKWNWKCPASCLATFPDPAE
jgi:hypothetical protein